jgi:hypothetical protein
MIVLNTFIVTIEYIPVDQRIKPFISVNIGFGKTPMDTHKESGKFFIIPSE